jgi:hypothetical protein
MVSMNQLKDIPLFNQLSNNTTAGSGAHGCTHMGEGKHVLNLRIDQRGEKSERKQEDKGRE